MKRCTKCGEEKESDDFYRSRRCRDGLYPQCKNCARASKATSRARHYDPKRQREYVRRYKSRHPERVRAQERARRLRRHFGLTIEDAVALIASQGGLCAICDQAETALSSARQRDQRVVRTLSVDHCHRTGRVRGALCSRCNTALGLLDESPERLRRATDYLTGVSA